MKAFLFVLFVFLFQSSVQANSSELELIQRDAVSDFKIQQQLKYKDARKQYRLKTFSSVFQVNAASSGKSCEQKCQDLCSGSGGGGSGAEACWTQCSREGYSSSTCASRCGVSNSTGSEACWNACGKEGYSSSTCSERCKTDTGGGSAACWGQCGQEGYSSSTCASRCGVSTSAGSGACWSHCTREGYSSSTCTSRCGTN